MFWDIFLKLCMDSNKTPNAVAKELGISSGSVTNWKNGSVPQSAKLKKIADYFGVAPGQLLGEPIKKAPPFITYEADNEFKDRLNRVLLYVEQNGLTVPATDGEREQANLERVTDAERALLDLFRQFPEDSQRVYLEALRAALKK